ncbi:ABC transporter permease [Hyalangium versicolor]|uniref:ABC transporter permease n=1 Tax=Hyalangium versicolor TaxID=2861190 RepID=UPI001CCBDE3B|nr:iron chelate uptake ABC transporter family permease subunit [Hyalangium versicolor]
MRLAFFAGLVVLCVLGLSSTAIGVSDISWGTLLSAEPGGQSMQLLLVSRLPRTFAIVLSGAALGMAGLIMQMIARNRFVEPSTAGTSESASLGVLAITLVAPDASLFSKMVCAASFALAGTTVFLLILRRIPLRSALVVPLLGLILGSVIDSVTTFFAYRFDLLQSLSAWTVGDFSSVLRGRYELLWGAFALTALAYLAADRFTLAGMGEAFATNLGLDYRKVVMLGLVIVSMVTAAVVVTVGMIPFLGMVVPNIVSMAFGDNARRSLPWVALLGAIFVLACDIVGRVVRAPYEIPVGMIAGVLGSALFLVLLRKRAARAS